ncbi:MAG: LacI family DNA-binding transcriptional regulator [Clostridia bacterium]|nr:LacI family DNA-binding transcriptional regulator [Clostridia bacterium]
MGKPVRMADIAKQLGISIVSVSKGLSGKDGVSEKLREQILSTAKEMGYHTAKSTLLDEMKEHTVGILVLDRFFNENALYYNLYRDLLNACQKRNLIAMHEIVSNDSERKVIVPALVEANRVDGLIFLGEFSSDYIRTASKAIPFVLLDFFKDDLSADSIVSDNLHGGYIVTRHLLSKGYHKIGFVGSIRATNSIMDRYLGYCKALYQHGLQPRADWRIEDRDDEGLFIPFHLPEDMPNAFVCNCDEVAYNLVNCLKGLGYRIPEDIAVTGYDDFRFASLSRPKLTTYAINVSVMADAAAAILSRRIRNKSVDTPICVVPGHLIVRESD